MDRFRVWPDGTVQSLKETAHHWLNDDYVIVDAADEHDALLQVILGDATHQPTKKADKP